MTFLGKGLVEMKIVIGVSPLSIIESHSVIHAHGLLPIIEKRHKSEELSNQNHFGIEGG